MVNTNSDDVEFATVLAAFKRSTVKLFNGIAWLIRFSGSKLLIHLIFIAVGVGLSYTFYSISKPIYVSTMSVENKRLENDFCSSLIKTISTLKKDPLNNDLLSKRLKLDLATIDEIKSIEYKQINDKVERIYQDSLSFILPFQIEIKTYNIKILDTVQSALLQYLESNEYATKLKEIDEKNLKLFEQRVDGELLSIDSLKQSIAKNLTLKNQTSSGINITESADPSRINEVSLYLFQRKLDTDKARKLNNSFEVISGFDASVIISSPGMVSFVISGAVISYLISLIILLWNHFRVKAKA